MEFVKQLANVNVMEGLRPLIVHKQRLIFHVQMLVQQMETAIRLLEFANVIHMQQVQIVQL